MKTKILNEFLTSDLNITNNDKLIQYIDFCIDNNTSKTPTKTSHHHILPKGIFEQYENLNGNPWNGAHLTYENHYIAHSILAEAINHPTIIGAWWGMSHVDKDTKSINGLEIIGSKKHAELFENAVKETSERNSGLVLCRLKSQPQETIKVATEEYHSNRHLYLSNTEGKVSVTEIATGNKLYINKEDYNKEIHNFHKTGSIRSKESIEQERITKQTVGEDGLTISQRAAYKGQETHKKKLEAQGIDYKEYLRERNSHKGEAHPSFGKKSIVFRPLNVSKRISVNEFYLYEEQGWVFGGKKFTRKIK